MGLRFALARAISATSAWGLTTVFKRPAANFPGKIALYADPQVIAHSCRKLARGSIVVVGTNGKTTVTNLIAEALEASGCSVICNRTGANLDSGVASALLRSQPADWGVFESDELWLAKILPQLQANYLVLLNLFRDQLDRVGEIDRIQESIAATLVKSPNTVLVYNADDPLCAAIAKRAATSPARANTPCIPFGLTEDMGLPQNTVTDAQMCQECAAMLHYDYRQYGQLGQYRCEECGFERPALAAEVSEVELSLESVAFRLRMHGGEGAEARTAAEGVEGCAAAEGAEGCAAAEGAEEGAVLAAAGVEGAEGRAATPCDLHIHAKASGAYMVYNLAAVAIACELAGCPREAMQRALDAFEPHNGRLERFTFEGRPVLLNLAKNPTGFNQNLRIILQDSGPRAVAFFINDKEADGRDVSWLWDIDFEELAGIEGMRVYAGGIRRYDMQVRLKYAGVQADVIESPADMLARCHDLPEHARLYLISNYTALPVVRQGLVEALGEGEGEGVAAPAAAPAPAAASASTPAPVPTPSPADVDMSPLRIVHLFPDLLNLYGDGGNVKCLAARARWRGIPAETTTVHYGEEADLASADIVFLGGGPDREQRLASVELLRMRDDLHAYVEDDGVLLAICGGYQILGHEWLLGDESVEGLGILDIVTKRVDRSPARLIDNIVLRSSMQTRPVVGYENHAGRTFLGAGVQPFGEVVSSVGWGNNDDDKADGVLYRNVVGTYLHGPLLSKNPGVADELISRALSRRAKHGEVVPALDELASLADVPEVAASDFMLKRLNVRA